MNKIGDCVFNRSFFIKYSILLHILCMTFSFVKPLFADELAMQESNAQYARGIEDASLARFDEAERDFKRALEFNDLNYDAREALRLLNAVKDGTTSKDLVLAVFLNKKLGFQISKLEARLKQIEDENTLLKRNIDIMSAKGSGVTREVDSRISSFEFRINKMENEIDYIKRRTDLR